MKVNVLSRLRIIAAVQVKQVKGSDYPDEANAFVKKLMKLVKNGTIEISSNEVDHADVPVVRYIADSGKYVDFFMESYDGKWYTYEDMDKPCNPKKVIDKLLGLEIKLKPQSSGLPEVPENERKEIYNSLDTKTKKVVDSIVDYLKESAIHNNSLYAEDWLQHSIFGQGIRAKAFKDNFSKGILCIAPFFNKLLDKKVQFDLMKKQTEHYLKSPLCMYESPEDFFRKNHVKDLDEAAEKLAGWHLDSLNKIKKYLEKHM